MLAGATHAACCCTPSSSSGPTPLLLLKALPQHAACPLACPTRALATAHTATSPPPPCLRVGMACTAPSGHQPRCARMGGGGIVTSSHARTHARTHAEHVGRRRRRTRRRSRALGALRSAPPVIHDTENRSTRPVGRVASSMKLCAASQRPHPAAHWPPTGHALIMHRASQPHPLCTGQRS
jgi:hypothetical protein